jgi:hypothetical protein
MFLHLNINFSESHFIERSSTKAHLCKRSFYRNATTLKLLPTERNKKIRIWTILRQNTDPSSPIIKSEKTLAN